MLHHYRGPAQKARRSRLLRLWWCLLAVPLLIGGSVFIGRAREGAAQRREAQLHNETLQYQAEKEQAAIEYRAAARKLQHDQGVYEQQYLRDHGWERGADTNWYNPRYQQDYEGEQRMRKRARQEMGTLQQSWMDVHCDEAPTR